MDNMKLFPEFEDDVEFAKQLIVEQGVTYLPGSVSVDHFPFTMMLALSLLSLSLSLSLHTHVHTPQIVDINFGYPFALPSSCPITN